MKRKFKKICAKFRSGVRFGIGVILERACGPECRKCNGLAFDRSCRFFDFRPHHEVKLERKIKIPILHVSSASISGSYAPTDISS